MIITIPIPAGKQVDARVYDGVLSQSMPCELVICEREGVIDSQRNMSPERIEGEIRSRKACVEEAKKKPTKYVVMMDADVVLSDERTIESMSAELESNPLLGAVALYFGTCPKKSLYMPHVVIRCCMYRIECFLAINWDEPFKGCTCNLIKHQIEGMGYRMRYESWIHRAYEIF